MEEADVLGDRIAIMAEGQVKCCGSPMFLKTYLGAGYSITVTKDSQTASEPILKLVQKHAPTSKIKNENSLEIIIEMDLSGTSKLPDLAQDLDKNRENLGYSSFGFSRTTIEDVFLKVGEGRDKHINIDDVGSNVYNEYSVTNIPKVKGTEMYLNHFKGLFMKRIIATMRTRKIYLGLSFLAFLATFALGQLNKKPRNYLIFALKYSSNSRFKGSYRGIA